MLSRDVFVVTGCEDGIVRVFHALSGIQVRSLCSESSSPVYSIALTLKEMKANVVDTEPILAVSSKAGSVQLWHLDTGRLLRTLQPHNGPILCMVMTSGTSNTRPNSSVCRKAAGAAAATGLATQAKAASAAGKPLIITGGADCFVVVTRLTSFLDDAVQAYEMDQKERLPRIIMQQVPEKFSQWPRIYLLSQRFGSMEEFFASDNFLIFEYAMADDRLDFLSTFLPHACTGLLIASRKAAVARGHTECIKMHKERGVIKAVNTQSASWYLPSILLLPTMLMKAQKIMQIEQNESLLFQAVEKRNALVVRVILEAWLGMVLEPPKDLLDQTAGPAMCLSKSDLVQVAAVFPAEFENYICSLRLVKVHSDVQQNCTQTMHPSKKTMEAAGKGRFQDDMKIWTKDNAASQESLTCLYLPLHQAADPEMVHAYIKVSENLRSIKIFFSEVGIVSNHYAWGKHGMKIHRIGTGWYLFDCLCFVIFLLTSGNDNDTLVVFRGLAIFFMSSYIAARSTTMMLQIVYDLQIFGGVKLSFLDSCRRISAWGVYEFVWYSVRTAASYMKTVSPVLYSISALVQWGKLLYYFRAFESTGLLIAMILQIVGEIKFYIFVIFLIYLFFTQSLWVLNSEDLSHAFKTSGDDYSDDASRFASARGNAFGNQRSSLLTAFTFMFGNYQPGFFAHLENDYIRRWSISISIVFMLVVCIVMFNLLIAFMSDIFVRMSQRGVAQWRLMQAKTMHESGFEIARMQIASPKIIHVLKRTSDINMDLLQESFEGANSESVAESIIRVAEQVNSDTTAKIMASEKVVLDRLAAQHVQLQEMLAKIEEMTINPNAAKTDNKL